MHSRSRSFFTETRVIFTRYREQVCQCVCFLLRTKEEDAERFTEDDCLCARLYFNCLPLTVLNLHRPADVGRVPLLKGDFIQPSVEREREERRERREREMRAEEGEGRERGERGGDEGERGRGRGRGRLMGGEERGRERGGGVWGLEGRDLSPSPVFLRQLSGNLEQRKHYLCSHDTRRVTCHLRVHRLFRFEQVLFTLDIF